MIEPGTRFGWLTIEAYIGKNAHGEKIYRCKCACGQTIERVGSLLTKRKVTSCGCRRRWLARKRSYNPARATVKKYNFPVDYEEA